MATKQKKSTKTSKPAKKAEDNRTIRVLAPENPKRAGTAAHKRFALYRDGMTVSAALAAGVTTADIAHDTNKKFIAVDKAPATQKPAETTAAA